MNNIIPEMPTDAVTPYCIWYPDIATEETYRELSRRYPRMRYQVGRACAVAGYNKLFDELQLLPDVSIAEEAEDNNNAYIRDAIISKPARYAVMNDYTRTIDIDEPRAGACLNGDTAVRSSLEKKRPHGHDTEERDFLEYSSHYFDIQEDRHVRPEHWRGPEHTVLQSQYADLIYKPLPRDLPPINKDIVIIMAAWDGNIDRYSRLRRPQPVENEISAVIRGAYHHTPFARWLETCLEDLFPDESESVLVRQAINARFIMNNDLYRIDRFTHGDSLPEFFWWPHCPHPITLREFAWRRPDMTHQIALACIAGEYRELFDELAVNLKPTAEMWGVAQQCPDEYYREQVKKCAHAQGVTLYRIFSAGSHRYLGRIKEMYRTSYLVHLPKELHNTPDEHDEDWEEWHHPAGELFNYHMHSQIADWQTFISAKDDAIELLGNTDGCFYHSSADDLRRRSEPGPEPPFPKKFDSDEDDTDEDDIYTW
ncbi:hypothetical protein CGCS363_v008682 [Colletotrichum siamense]|uniref:uncharacterized protein n=1 Tax=Colletotrichum siamense TaxID=690259 RepID=UPI001872B24A|nr:uncharacterized protein CGCS363_v008682 [Colletotrichum siamense]KAF5497429.1 hypothetical protein CGCS363_v008682 [Colletotrichum siamense]